MAVVTGRLGQRENKDACDAFKSVCLACGQICRCVVGCTHASVAVAATPSTVDTSAVEAGNGDARRPRTHMAAAAGVNANGVVRRTEPYAPSRGSTHPWYQPRSFFSLVLLGFAVALVPLIVGLVNAASTVNDLAARSRAAVERATHASENGWLAFQQLAAMERNAKQFHVLGDPALLRAYMAGHARFVAAADALAAVTQQPPQRARLAHLVASERAIFATLMSAAPRSPLWRTTSDRFGALVGDARAFLDAHNRQVADEIAQVQTAARRAQRSLLWQALALIPGALLLTALFSVLIARPIRQIERAIRRLGDGEFKAPVRVNGPHDLQQLALRLDWLRKRLAEVEADKKKFLQHVSHELKTPLSTLREGTDLLAEQTVGRLNDQQREIAQILHSNCNHLQKLIEDLLNFNLAEARATPMQWDDFQLDEIVTRVLQQHKPGLLGKRLRVETELPPTPVRGDAQKLAAIVDNLLSNAVKYSPLGGALKITLALAREFVVLDVSDEGPGIAEGDQARVFIPFYQGNNQAAGHVKGTGLGLAIAKEYAGAHHGELMLVPSARGAQFRLILPNRGRLRHAS